MRTEFAIAAVMVAWMFVTSAKPQNPWRAFVDSPSEQNFAVLADPLKRCKGEECSQFAVTEAEEIRFCRLIEKRNRLAVELGVLSLEAEDGGDLEDVMTSLGTVADRNPTMLLRLIKHYDVDPGVFESIMNMLPESVFDSDAKRRRAISHRIESLSRVSDPTLMELRDRAIATLERYMSELHK